VQVDPSQGWSQGWGPWVYGGRSGDALGGHVFTSGGTLIYADPDDDGYGDADSSLFLRAGASIPSGYADNALDCANDDNDAPMSTSGSTSTWTDCGTSSSTVTFSGTWSFTGGTVATSTASNATMVTCAGLSGSGGATKAVTLPVELGFALKQDTTSVGAAPYVEGALYGCVVDEAVSTVATSPDPFDDCSGVSFILQFVQPVPTDSSTTPAGSLVMSYGDTAVSTPVAGTPPEGVDVGDVEATLTWSTRDFERADGTTVSVSVPASAVVEYGNLSHTVVTGYLDSDADLLPELDEVELHGTDADTDGDGVLDGVEIAGGSNPNDDSTCEADTDGDGLDLATEELMGTDPEDSDSDGDGVQDLDEIRDGTDPNDETDSSFTDDNGNGIDDRNDDASDTGDSGDSGDSGAPANDGDKDWAECGCDMVDISIGAFLVPLGLLGFARRRRWDG